MNMLSALGWNVVVWGGETVHVHEVQVKVGALRVLIRKATGVGKKKNNLKRGPMT